MKPAPSRERARTYDALAISATALVVLVAVAYAEIVYTYDLTTLIVSVVSPVCLGAFFISLRRNLTMFYAYLALIWAVLDDRPIFFDSVLTWPEVTRFHPLLPRLVMNLVIHGLSVVFLYLAVREASKGANSSFWRSPRVIIPAILCLVLAYAQNIPLPAVQDIVQAGKDATSWFSFDLVTKLLSLLFLYIALREASGLERSALPRGEPVLVPRRGLPGTAGVLLGSEKTHSQPTPAPPRSEAESPLWPA